MCIQVHGAAACARLYPSGVSPSHSGPVSVLRAIDEDSPTVPTLLTDYILKGRCLLAALGRRLRAAVRSPRAPKRAAAAPPPPPPGGSWGRPFWAVRVPPHPSPLQITPQENEQGQNRRGSERTEADGASSPSTD